MDSSVLLSVLLINVYSNIYRLDDVICSLPADVAPKNWLKNICKISKDVSDDIYLWQVSNCELHLSNTNKMTLTKVNKYLGAGRFLYTQKRFYSTKLVTNQSAINLLQKLW